MTVLRMKPLGVIHTAITQHIYKHVLFMDLNAASLFSVETFTWASKHALQSDP